jgi:competence protein ComEA
MAARKHLLIPTHTRLERLGYAALALLFAGLLLIRLRLARPPAPSAAEEAASLALARSWAAFEQAHPPAASDYPGSSYGGRALREDNISNLSATLFAFDPNTADSATLRQLGLSARAAHGLLNWRDKGKKFYRKEDLKPLYNLPEELYARLEPYIVISISRENGSYYESRYRLPPLPATLDLNSSDSATLVRLNGIGPTLAHKIVVRRAALGGFLRHEQLLEIYRFPDSTFRMLREKLTIRPEAVRRLALNSAPLALLSAHPYIGEKMAQNIVLYREGLKRFSSVQQLRQVPLMNEEKYRSIAPYFELD